MLFPIIEVKSAGIHIMWSSSSVQIIQIHITYNDGEDWHPVTDTGGISQGNPLWGDYTWTIPAATAPTATARFRVSEYLNESVRGVSGTFSITAGSSIVEREVAQQAVDAFSVLSRGNGVTFGAGASAPDRVEIFDMMGKRVAVLARMAGNDLDWSPQRATGSTYIARMTRTEANGAVRTVHHRFTVSPR